jgi:multidrug transporter EmrE-like cation transporter
MLLVLFASFIGSFGAVLLKMGSNKLKDGFSNLFNIRLAAGVGLYLLSTCFFIVALKNGELTVLYPMVSLGYVWTLLWSRLFFGEPFTRYKFIGLFLILVGVSLIGMGRESHSEESQHGRLEPLRSFDVRYVAGIRH